MENSDWNNDHDYRRYVTIDDITKEHEAEDWQVAARSVGTLISVDDLIPVNKNDISKHGYKIRYPQATHRISLQYRIFRDQRVPKADLGSHRFLDDTKFGNGTCYYIGDGVVVTAGHVLDGGDGLGAKTPARFVIVFGVTDEYCTKDQTKQVILPSNRVFSFDRILYKQNEQRNRDSEDWALLMIKPKHADVNTPFPPALKVLTPLPSYNHLEGPQNLFAIGHPWGLSMKLTDPSTHHPAQPRVPRRLLITINPEEGGPQPLKNTIRHNLLNHPGNSGGPLFMRTETGAVVIGTTTANGSPGPGMLGQHGMHWDSSTKLWRLDVPADDVAEWRKFNVASRTDLWYHLVAPDANINLVYKFTPGPNTIGRLKIFLQVLFPRMGEPGIHSIEITSVKIVSAADYVSRKIKIVKTFSSLVALVDRGPATVTIKPCFIVGVKTAYVFTDGDTESDLELPGQMDLVTLSVSGIQHDTPSSVVTIIREADKPANGLIDRPVSLTSSMKGLAQKDEKDAVQE